MIAKISNLGVIRNAEIDLRKPFTLFCGPNSTGKTYLSYLIYAILENIEYFKSSCLEKVTSSLIATNEFEITPDIVRDFLKDFASHIADINTLGSVFGIGDESVKKLFSKFELSLEINDTDLNAIKAYPCNLVSQRSNTEFSLSKEKDSNKLLLSISNENSNSNSKQFLKIMISHYFHLLCFGNLSGVRMLTVERNSIYTFKTELSITRNELIDKIQQKSSQTELDILDIINSSSRRYPLAIRDSLRIANDLENVKKNKSLYFDVAESIERGILQGEVKITNNGDVEFVSERMGKSKHLPIHLTSSIVKTMSSLVIYLKHIARKGDLLIIDEPEMNFHPDVQLLLIRIFAQLTKMDLRIIVSTHSDYIVREINNLIMAKNIYDKKADLIKYLGYEENMLLSKNDLSVKYFNFGRRKKTLDVMDIPINDDGFAINSMDFTISSQNHITETLFGYLQEECYE